MAKDKGNKEEKQKLSKEELAEQKELEKQKKLREQERKKKQQLKLKKAKAKQKSEIKRIKMLINLPFKVIINVSIIAALLSFLITYFILNKDPISTVLTSFFIFTLIYLGVGIVIVGFFLLLSFDKEKEMREFEAEQIRLQQEEELKKQQEEMRELEAIEKEIAASRFQTDRAKKYMETESTTNNNSIMEDDLGPDLLGPSNTEFNPLDAFAAESSQDEDYLKEIMK